MTSPDNYEIDYRLSDDEENTHSSWDNSLEPVLTVEASDVVRFECCEPAGRQVSVQTTAKDVSKISFDPVHTLTGPVAVKGAQPGDILKVELLELKHKGWGYTLFFPGAMELGLLSEDFDDPSIHIWDLEDDIGHFVNDIEVPLAPFPGTIGLAPSEDGTHSTNPPRHVGGNVDIKHLTASSTLYLPVEVERGLFSTGDCHAAQGDGEVSVAGIEAPMFVTARFDICSDMSVEQPQFETQGPFTPTGADEPMYGTSGISDDLMEATKLAIRHMIDHLHEKRGLSRGEAYILCSAVVDLKINEVVNAPNWVVSAYLPENIFPKELQQT